MLKDIVTQVMEYQLKVEYKGTPNLKIESIDKYFNVVLNNDLKVPLHDVHLMPLMVLNQENGIVSEWGVRDMIDEINRDRNSEWLDYDRRDFLEGWFEWVEGEILMLVQ